jgi:hypothetical protein
MYYVILMADILESGEKMLMNWCWSLKKLSNILNDKAKKYNFSTNDYIRWRVSSNIDTKML